MLSLGKLEFKKKKFFMINSLKIRVPNINSICDMDSNNTIENMIRNIFLLLCNSKRLIE